MKEGKHVKNVIIKKKMRKKNNRIMDKDDNLKDSKKNKHFGKLNK